MRSKSVLILITTVFILAFTASVHGQYSEDFKMTISGPGVIPLGVELNGNPLALSLCAGLSTMHKVHPPRPPVPRKEEFTCTTTGYAILAPREEWPARTENCPNGFEAVVVEGEGNHIVRFANGDMMWWVRDTDAPNYSCANFNGTGLAVRSWEIVGGSGRYEGVTGTATWWIPSTAVPLGSARLWAAHDGIVEGTIIY